MANFTEKSMPTHEILSSLTLLVLPKQPYFETLSMDELQYSSALTGGDEFPIAGLRLKANPALLLSVPTAEIIPDLIRRKNDVLVGLFV